jgi:arginase
VRDLAPYQRSRLERSRIRTIPCPPWRGQDFGAALVELRQRVEGIYLHIDLDALDVSEGIANRYAAPGGLTLEQLIDAVRAVFARFRVHAAALTAYDPAYDSDGRMAKAAAGILSSITEAAQEAI